MRAIDRTKYHSKTLHHLDLLKVEDPLRIGYYTDLASKWSIEYKLDNWINPESFDIPIDFSDLNLVTICYEQYLCVSDQVNFTNCSLRTENTPKLEALENCGVHVIKSIS